MNLFDKAVKMAQRANKREKRPVFMHCTYTGISMAYKHMNVIGVPTYLVNGDKVIDVTKNIDNADYAQCSRYVEV